VNYVPPFSFGQTAGFGQPSMVYQSGFPTPPSFSTGPTPAPMPPSFGAEQQPPSFGAAPQPMQGTAMGAYNAPTPQGMGPQGFTPDMMKQLMQYFAGRTQPTAQPSDPSAQGGLTQAQQTAPQPLMPQPLSGVPPIGMGNPLGY
jgi:hypothetical protein